MILALGAKLPSEPLVFLLVALVLYLVSLPIARRVAQADGDPRLVKLIMISLGLHFLGGPAQILVDNHIYHGVADFTGYVHQGATLSHNFQSFHFTTHGAQLRSLVGDGSVSIATGVVFSIVGINELAAFFIFSWFAWLGTVFFYRAFALTFPEGGHRRYALMLFLFPSLLFWTSDVSKETIMLLSLGVVTLGVARVLARQRRGYPLIVLGTALGIFTRPNELALLLGAFAVAMLFRRPDRQQQARAARRLGSFVFVALILVVTAIVTLKLVRGSHGSLGHLLSNTNKNNTSTPGATGSNVSYSPDPLLYPKDLYVMLFDPLPITAASLTQAVAALENTVVLVLIVTSWRRLKLFYRAARERPYVALCTVYSAVFIYTFAALGNLGLITRERTLLFPYMLVLLAVPVATKGQPPQYPWEKRPLPRRERRLAEARAAEFLRPFPDS